MRLTTQRLVELAMTNPINAEMTARLPALGLDQCLLTAGCLFQAVWNHQAGLSADWGVKEYFGSTPSPRSRICFSRRPEAIRPAGRGSGLKTRSSCGRRATWRRSSQSYHHCQQAGSYRGAMALTWVFTRYLQRISLFWILAGCHNAILSRHY